MTRLSVIQEVTEVWINVGGIRGYIHNTDDSGGVSQANEKVTCLEVFPFTLKKKKLLVAEKAIIQETEIVEQRTPFRWDILAAVAREVV